MRYVFRFILLPFLFYLFPTYNVAATGSISGQISYHRGKKISLMIYDNFITNTEKEIAQSLIDSSGNFKLNYKLYHTQYCFLKVNYIEESFVLMPGQHYQVTFNSTTKLNAEQLNSPNVSDFISLTVLNDELNQKLGELNETYNNFIISNSLELTNRGGQKKVEELEKNLTMQFATFLNPYFQQCLQYKMASLKLMTNFYSTTKFAEIYFGNKPILYQNIEYMDVLNQFFTKYVKNFSLRNENSQTLKDLINSDPDYDNINHLLYQDQILRSDTLRELILLKGLFELYYDKDYAKNNIVNLIHYLEGCALYKNNRDIAENMGNIFLSSTQAPNFTLHDINRNLISLSSFKGKYLYLNFWKSEIPESTMEFDVMEEYYPTAKEKVEFVSICVDSKFEKMKEYLNQHTQYQWKFLYYDNNFNLLEAYKVVSFPSFILIDPRGYIVDYSAPRPAENLNVLLTQILSSP